MFVAGKTPFQNSFLALLGFYFSFFLLFFLLEYLSGGSSHIFGSGFLNWDAKHYFEIRENGYSTGMVAFFPLFPFIWKGLLPGAVFISVVNGLIFISALSWLAVVFAFRLKNLLLLASIPTFIFAFLPYSESVFFLTSSMMLVGMKQNRFGLLLAGILLSGLARPVATVFIPSIIVVYFFFSPSSLSRAKTWGLLAACLVSFAAVLLLQYIQTGEALSFFDVQKGWGNSVRVPDFPLTSWAGGFIVRLDALSFFFGIASLAALAYLLLRYRHPESFNMNTTVRFSICYLAFLTLLILLTRGGVLNSLNRYLFCTPFFIIAINWLLEQNVFNRKNMMVLFFTSSLTWLLFGSYVHIQTLLKFELLTLYLLLLLAILSENKRVAGIAYYVVVACNILLMFVFYHRFLNDLWVG